MLSIRKRLAKNIRAYSHEEFLYYVFSARLAPVFKGLRPSCLFCLYDKGRPLYSTWKKIEADFVAAIPLRVKILSDDGKGIRIFIYDSTRLNEALQQPGINWFLKKENYDVEGGLEAMLNVLSSRFSKECPHEIGIFLGYPLHDVMNFIHKYRPCLFTGYWKVYCHPHEAQKTFADFDNARQLVEEKILANHCPMTTFLKLCEDY